MHVLEINRSERAEVQQEAALCPNKSRNRANLQRGDQSQSAGTLDELVEQATGTALPVTALFDWLNNRPAEVVGWQADLSQLGQGRLQLRRTAPLPVVELRLKLDQ